MTVARHACDVIEVRDAVIDDADAIATAHIDGWRVGYRGVVPDEYLDAEEFATSSSRPVAGVDLAVGHRFAAVRRRPIHERVVGFGHAGPEEMADRHTATTPSTPRPDRRGEIYGFYLHPSAWGSGSAGALMSRCEEFLRDEGFTSAVLWVLRDNPRARAFYEKAGWHATGRGIDVRSVGAQSPIPAVAVGAAIRGQPSSDSRWL